MWKRIKVTDARFRVELQCAKRDFPFRLAEMEKEGELDLEFIRQRTANQLFDITKRAGEFVASNFDCASSREAENLFDVFVDEFGRFVFEVVASMRRHTDELDRAARNGLETTVRRVVIAKRRRKTRGQDGNPENC